MHALRLSCFVLVRPGGAISALELNGVQIARIVGTAVVVSALANARDDALHCSCAALRLLRGRVAGGRIRRERRNWKGIA